MSTNYENVLQNIVDAQVKKLVFAGFPEFRDGEIQEEELAKKILKGSKKEDFVEAFKTENCFNEDFKTMCLSALEKAQKELHQKTEKILDIAIRLHNQKP